MFQTRSEARARFSDVPRWTPKKQSARSAPRQTLLFIFRTLLFAICGRGALRPSPPKRYILTACSRARAIDAAAPPPGPPRVLSRRFFTFRPFYFLFSRRFGPGKVQRTERASTFDNIYDGPCTSRAHNTGLYSVFIFLFFPSRISFVKNRKILRRVELECFSRTQRSYGRYAAIAVIRPT